MSPLTEAEAAAIRAWEMYGPNGLTPAERAAITAILRRAANAPPVR